MTINAINKTIKITPSTDGNRYAKYNASSNARFGGNSSISWTANSGLSAGQSLIIKTDGTYNFGGGPTLLIYDDFSGGTVGANIPTGNWSGISYSQPIYDSGGRDGNTAMKIFRSGQTSTNRIRAFNKTFANTTEIFVQFSVYTGTEIGGPAANTFSSNSFWKMIWVSDATYGGGADGIANADGIDIVLGTYVSRGISITGNDTLVGNTIGLTENILRTTNKWDFLGWNTISIWLKGDPVNPATSNTTASFAFVNKRVNTREKSNSEIAFNFNYPAVLNRVQVPGWFGNLDSDNGDNLLWKYDDVYITTGANSAARVVLGNANTWSSCRDIWVCKPNSWSANTIDVEIPKTLNGIKNMYIYIFNGDDDLLSNTGVYIE